jgi:uncharacterized protein YnzC (UPF0291/DUF896 family)
VTQRLERINELAKKAREVGLTPEETAEQARLRKEYLAAFRKNMEAQLENTYLVGPDGEKRKLPRKN